MHSLKSTEYIRCTLASSQEHVTDNGSLYVVLDTHLLLIVIL